MIKIKNFFQFLINWFKSNSQLVVITTIALILVTIVISPLFQVGFVADNLVNYSKSWSYNGLLADIQAIPNTILNFIAQGRIHLTSLLIVPFLNIVRNQDVFYNHLFTLFFTLLSVITYIGLIRQLQPRHKRWLLLSVIFLPILFQIRSYHDPFLVYFGDFQMQLSIFFVSLIFYTKYLKTKKKKYALWSVILFFIIANMHEANIMFLPLYVIIFWFQKKKLFNQQAIPIVINVVIAVISYFASSIGQIIFNISLQSYDYSGVSANLDWKNILITGVTQIIASFPHNFLFGRQGWETVSYYPHLFTENLPILFLSLIVFSVIFYIVNTLFKKYPLPINRREVFYFIFFGITLLALPAFPVAISAKYQADLALFGMKGGIGYVMVIYQYFGVAVLLGTIFYLILTIKKTRSLILIVMSFLFSFSFYITYCANLASVKQVNKAYEEHHYIISQANRHGFFEALKGNTINIFTSDRDTNYYSVGDNNYTLMIAVQQILGKEVKIEKHCANNQMYYVGMRQSLGTCDEFLTENNYFLYYDQVDEYAGYVILAPLANYVDYIAEGKEVQIYYYSSYLNNNWPGGIYPALRRDLYTSYYIKDENEQLVQKHNRQWIVRDRKTNSTTISFEENDLILLDSLIPTLIQDDRSSLKMIQPVN